MHSIGERPGWCLFPPMLSTEGRESKRFQFCHLLKKNCRTLPFLILYHECMSEIKTILLAFEDTLGWGHCFLDDVRQSYSSRQICVSRSIPGEEPMDHSRNRSLSDRIQLVILRRGPKPTWVKGSAWGQTEPGWILLAHCAAWQDVANLLNMLRLWLQLWALRL